MGVKSELGISETDKDNPEEGTPSEPEEPGEGDEGTKPKGTGGKSGKPAEEVDYKEKFANSTRENQRIREEIEAAEEDAAELRATNARLQTEMESYLKELREDDPGSARIIKVEQTLKSLEQSTLLAKEGVEVVNFIEGNPAAKGDREALRALMRTHPRKSPEYLWDKYLKPAYDRGFEEGGQKLRGQNATRPESGKGSKTGEPTDEYPDDFNQWPLAKRKAWFKKKGLGGEF